MLVLPDNKTVLLFSCCGGTSVQNGVSPFGLIIHASLMAEQMARRDELIPLRKGSTIESTALGALAPTLSESPRYD